MWCGQMDGRIDEWTETSISPSAFPMGDKPEPNMKWQLISVKVIEFWQKKLKGGGA